MDSALLREREQFKKKAASMPAVEKRQNTSQLDNQSGNKKRKLNTRGSTEKHQNFAALAKVVQYLRTRYLGGDKNPATREKMLEETKQSDLHPDAKSWLFDDALKNNPKVQVVQDKFIFKPIYKLDNALSLSTLLKKYKINGLGGILWDDVVESLPNAEIILKNFENSKRIIVLTRSSNKKKVIFHNDPKTTLNIDEYFKNLWNAIDVDALDDNEIMNYLEKEGLCPIKGEEFKRPIMPSPKRSTRKKQSKKPKDNAHLADVLESYEDNTLTQKGS